MDNKENFKFLQNKNCEYFPCHKKNIEIENFNCLFCYCPLYALKENCGGNFKYTNSGVKDCSNCLIPHIKEKGYSHIKENIKKIIEICKSH